jgi:pimeloyl-ACP methyl ester carboxylesterase
MARPRVLLVPWITQLEWRIAPLVEQWAEVASYDCPGVGDEPAVEPHDADAVVARGLSELERLGWDGCIVAGDELGAAIAVRIAAERPDVVDGLALGHACLCYDDDSPDAPVNGHVMAGFNTLLETDYRSWVRAYTQLTQGAYDDDTMNRFLERVPPAVCVRHADAVDALAAELDVEAALRELGAPLLMAEHRDCLVFRREGFEHAARAFPGAMRVTTREKPSCSPAFADALREFAASRVSA